MLPKKLLDDLMSTVHNFERFKAFRKEADLEDRAGTVHTFVHTHTLAFSSPHALTHCSGILTFPRMLLQFRDVPCSGRVLCGARPPQRTATA